MAWRLYVRYMEWCSEIGKLFDMDETNKTVSEKIFPVNCTIKEREMCECGRYIILWEVEAKERCWSWVDVCVLAHGSGKRGEGGGGWNGWPRVVEWWLMLWCCWLSNALGRSGPRRWSWSKHMCRFIYVLLETMAMEESSLDNNKW